jgi:hypothetical protein
MSTEQGSNIGAGSMPLPVSDPIRGYVSVVAEIPCDQGIKQGIKAVMFATPGGLPTEPGT